MNAIHPELAAFLESGLSVLVGTRDARNRPHSLRAMGARVEDEGRELTVFLPDATAGPNLADLRETSRIAVTFCLPRDHRSVQIKGEVRAVTRAAPADHAVLDAYVRAFGHELMFVGVPTRVVQRMAAWPCHAVRLRVESVFEQTPGPGAGAQLGAGDTISSVRNVGGPHVTGGAP